MVSSLRWRGFCRMPNHWRVVELILVACVLTTQALDRKTVLSQGVIHASETVVHSATGASGAAPAQTQAPLPLAADNTLTGASPSQSNSLTPTSAPASSVSCFAFDVASGKIGLCSVFLTIGSCVVLIVLLTLVIAFRQNQQSSNSYSSLAAQPASGQPNVQVYRKEEIPKRHREPREASAGFVMFV
eukprot:TRINITY_DN1012_c0_g1_i2.p1 TRINITY_DN1012_c0_g1~~TRINITY_DN1012_c0_g1_i2.p1  ORF type:complete len:187 (+),score=1.85 TRINITY_DN1012_c0_g1_i2:68-628(+)